MKMLSLLPKEEKFYHMMDELAGYANASARLLEVLVQSTDDEEIRRAGQQIADSKAGAKQLYEKLSAEVCRTFITPFDREDIDAFAYTVYNIPKLISKAQDRMVTHQLRPYNQDFTRMAEIIVQQAEAMEGVMAILKNHRKVKEMQQKTSVLHQLEDQGDQLLGQLIAELFYSISDTRELILRKDIYEMMEDVTDFYRDCANLALRIVLKHS